MPGHDDESPDVVSDEMARVLRDLVMAFAGPPSEETAEQHISRMVEVVRPPAPGYARRRAGRAALLVAGLTAGTALTGGFAAAGALPAPVQAVVAAVVEPLGITLPAGDDDAPDTTPPGQENTPPGQDKTPPGQDKTPPGQENTPPGQDKTPPGQENTPPGQENTPPGQENTPPGQENTPPGQENTPPGQENTPPGQENTPPGQENTPPGQGGGNGGGKPAK